MQHEFKRQLIQDGEDFLKCFEAFVVDEAHELRKLGIMIISVLKKFVKKYKGKHKIIVTSATLSTKMFEDYFSDMKTITMEGMTPTYDVEVNYTLYPDLESSIIENAAAHLREIFEVHLILVSILRENTTILRRLSTPTNRLLLRIIGPTFWFLCRPCARLKNWWNSSITATETTSLRQ